MLNVNNCCLEETYQDICTCANALFSISIIRYEVVLWFYTLMFGSVFRICLDDVPMVFGSWRGRCLGGVWKVLGRCVDGVWTVFGRCLDGALNCLEGLSRLGCICRPPLYESTATIT